MSRGDKPIVQPAHPEVRRPSSRNQRGEDLLPVVKEEEMPLSIKECLATPGDGSGQVLSSGYGYARIFHPMPQTNLHGDILETKAPWAAEHLISQA